MVKLICVNFPCEEYLPEKYFRVIRIIKTGNRRRAFNFCSTKCMVKFFASLTPLEEFELGQYTSKIP